MSGSRSGSRIRRLRGIRPALRRELHGAPGARFQRASFDERIAPLPQSRNVHVDPIVPPIQSARIITEIGLLGGRQRSAKTIHIYGLEVMIVVQNERLK